ncbi:ester cyclase [Amycolatopsis sp. NPDC059027]|uniref:ester cyclase n=1 Tax=Amycolatopsis sp. NPDC059027 TaxID=3346709 RepID=UPI00366DD134
MSKHAKNVLGRFLDMVNAHDLRDIGEVVTDDVTETGPIVVDAPSGGLENFRAGWEQMLVAFPDIHVGVETMLAEGDTVAATISLSATNTGYYRRGEATGKHATWRGFVVVRLRDGKIAEFDALTDRFGVLQQLGIIGDDDELAAPRQAS